MNERKATLSFQLYKERIVTQSTTFRRNEGAIYILHITRVSPLKERGDLKEKS